MPGERLDAFLAGRLPDLSRSRIQTLIRDQFILVNGQPAKPRNAVKLGDHITIALPEAVPLDAVAQDIPVLGHCLGGQLLAKAMGAKVGQNPVKEIGWA